MKNFKGLFIMVLVIMGSLYSMQTAHSTPSTHIWAPSTDTQDWGTGHVTADYYVPVQRNGDGSRARTITDEGLTFGMLPFNKLRAEAGFDFKTGYGDLDNWPVYFNAKIAIPENSYGPYFPAVAAGIYDVGTRREKTDNNIVYVKTAKTFKIKDVSLGRFSIGYFWGNDKLLLDGEGEKNADGIFWAWERTMTEISDKLWICAEYQATESAYGAFNLGFSVQFTKDISAIAGYQFYNNKNIADTATIQVDINY